MAQKTNAVADLGITNKGCKDFARGHAHFGSVGVSCAACVHRVRCLLNASVVCTMIRTRS